MIEAYINLNYQNKFGCTALIWAIKKGHEGAAKKLIIAGAIKELGDKNQHTALKLAQEYDNKNMIKLWSKPAPITFLYKVKTKKTTRRRSINPQTRAEAVKRKTTRNKINP